MGRPFGNRGTGARPSLKVCTFVQVVAQKDEELQDRQSIIDHLQDQLQHKELDINRLMAASTDQEERVLSAQV